MRNSTSKFPKFSHVAFGGTFDVIHKGHHILIKKAFEIGDYVHIGLTSDESIIHKRLTERILDYQTRKNNLEQYLNEEGYTGRYSIVEISSPFGTAATEARLEALVIGDEKPVRQRTERLNEQRRLNNLDPLEIIVVTYLKADNGLPISSTRIRLGEIEPDGQLSSQD
ncbi:MAG: phosphopantetheine adenylyltransferase [Promethearchaeota archaeon]